MLTSTYLRRRPTPQSERGNIVIVMTIILIMVTIGAAMAYRVIGNQSIVVSRQNTSAGVSGADAGVSDALFRLDQGTSSYSPGQSFCVKSADSNCVAGSIPGAPGVSYIATEVNPADWTVQALGTVNGKLGAVQESVTRTAAYPYALFGNTSLDLQRQRLRGVLHLQRHRDCLVNEPGRLGRRLCERSPGRRAWP